ncbi:protein HEXIM2 [Pimephales promelas]|nr:protein HEXIM2 [Pimephales promelas]
MPEPVSDPANDCSFHHLSKDDESSSKPRIKASCVDRIPNVPGSYKPSYDVMLRFYGLYKQAVNGPCTAPRPGFWDPIGRYKWDAWNQLGDMSRESAMAAYVDEMKKVAQEEDTETVLGNELQPESTEPFLPEGQGLTSDSESEVFCDSLEQLDTIKLAAMPGGNSSFQNGDAQTETSGIQEHHYSPLSQVTQMGAGHGGEGAEDRHGPPMRRRATERQEMQQDRRAPSGYMSHHNARWPERLSSGAGSGQGGGDNSKGGPNWLQDGQVQQQIILALQQLREAMQSVMERLEAQNSQWRSHLQCTAAEAEEKWWPFDFSGRTLLLLLVWPFVTQGLMWECTVMELIREETVLEDDSRGRQRDGLTSAVPSKQVQRNQLEICPSLVSGDVHPICRGRDRSDPEPKAGDAASDDGFPVNKTSNKRDSDCTSLNAEGLSDGRQGKKKHRRRPSKKKRRWKPYFKLTWEEKKELDERETARASRVRAEMFAKGLPVAPYNTTQFLMEEHDREEPDLNTELVGRKTGMIRSDDTASEDENFEAEEEDEEEGAGGGGGEGSDGMGRPGHAGGEFLQRDFSETYERYHVETLQNMSKQELVREYLELEKCMSRLEEENNWLRHVRRNPEFPADGTGAQRVRELEIEVERLRAENELLLSTRKSKGPGLNLSQSS